MVSYLGFRRMKPFRVIQRGIKFQTNQFSINNIFLCTQLNIKTVLFQTIQFSISIQFRSIWPIDRTLSDPTTSGQIGLGSNGNEGVLCIPQSSSIPGIWPSDRLVSYPWVSLWVLALCTDAVGVFYSPSGMDKQLLDKNSIEYFWKISLLFIW